RPCSAPSVGTSARLPGSTATASPANPCPSEESMSTPDTPPRHLGVLLFRGAEPLDALGPAQVLWSLDSTRRFLAPFDDTIVHLVAEEAGPVTLGYGLVVEATTSFADCPPLDALVVPGGSGGEEEDGTARWGRRFYERHEPTLAF